MRIRKHFPGCHPDLPDARDLARAVPQAADLPPTHDLRPLCPPVYNQGDLGSCTANAIAAAIEIDHRLANQPAWTPSRLFIYYNERAAEKMTATDSGGRLRDGLKSVAKQGVCPETLWAYDITRFAVKPDERCYVDALKNLALKYESVPQHSGALEQILFSGKAVIVHMTLYEGFESETVSHTGMVPLPGKFETSLGGHAVLCVGYDRPQQRFLMRNSWGPSWGLEGYFWLPYAYLCDPALAGYFWVIDAVSNGE